ncbi:MAG TPA: hypothetical protein VFI11_05240 [Anaerolineales bacterium]|nr:hypothetical protein [Anaerolineales bacterium]
MKKPEESFDAKKRYASVRQQQGAVQTDSDWNKPKGSAGKGPVRLPAWPLVIVVIAGLAIAAVLVGRRLVPGLARLPGSEILPAGSNPILVSLKQPTEGAYPQGGTLPVVAQALGSEAIISLELWADGVLADTAGFQGEDRLYVSASWDWTVPSLGEHLLLVRAVDARGRTGESNVVRLNGIADPGLEIRHTTGLGETPQQLATDFGADLTALLEANPGLAPDQVLPDGAVVVVPFAGQGPAEFADLDHDVPNIGSTDPAVAPPSPLSFWVQENLGGPDTQPPSAPVLDLAAAGCAARLFIADTSGNEAGFFVYRIGPGASSFTRLETLGPHAGSNPIGYDVHTTGGKYQFYVSAFNTGGEAASNLVAFETSDSACAPPGSGLRLEGDQLVLPQAVDLAFLYYSVDGKPWGRLPANPHAYYPPDEDSVALGGLLEGSNLDLDVWGWSGGELVSLGHLQTAIPPDAPPSWPTRRGPSLLEGCFLGANCTGDVGGTLWAKKFTIAKWQETGFQWHAPLEGVTGGLWQMSSQPFAFTCSLTPPDLLLSDLLPTQGGVTHFTIDFSKFAPPPLEFEDQPSEQMIEVGPLANYGVPTLGDDSLVEMQAAPNVALPGGTPPSNAYLGIPGGILTWDDGFPKFYVRVLPLVGGKPQCNPSNTVVVTVDTTPQPPIKFEVPDLSRFKILYEVKVTAYDPPVFPDSSLWGCVEVISVKDYSLSAMKYALALSTGDPVCPESFKGGNDDDVITIISDIGGLITAAWDFIADLYNKLDELVKEFLAKFNPICLTATWTAEAANSGKAKTTIEDGCKIGASIAVDVAKAYVGLPPSLPNYEELEGKGKDYLVELAAEEFESTTGIPCPDECKDLMRQGVDMAFDQLTAGSHSPGCVSESTAHQYGKEPLCPPKGVVVQPAYGSEYIPPIAWLQVRRLPGVEEPVPYPFCSVRVSMKIDYHFPGGTVWGPYSPTGTPSKQYPPADVTVFPFQGNGVDIPMLAPGQTVELAVPFRAAQPIIFPWTQDMFKKSQIPPENFGEDFYRSLNNGTTIVTATTYFREYSALAAQYGGLIPYSMPCAPDDSLSTTPSP